MIEYTLSKRQKDLLRSIIPGLKNGSIQKQWMVLFLGSRVTLIHSGISDEQAQKFWVEQAGLGDFELFVGAGFFEVTSWTEFEGHYTLLEKAIISAVENDFDGSVEIKRSISQTPRIFISYKRIAPDSSFAKRLNKRLGRVYGSTQVWFDEGIYAGQEWWDEIIDKISRSHVLIYLLSRESLESVYCRSEFSEAWRLGKQLLPVLIREHTIPQELRSLQYVKVEYNEDGDGDIKTDSIVEIFASITQQVTTSPVLPESLWANRVIQPAGDDVIKVRLKVPASVEPDDNQREICNTGILIVPGDKLKILAGGRVTIDNGSNWMNPDGVYPHPEYPTRPIFFHTWEAYKAKGYGQPEAGENGVVGSLFGWVGTDKSAIDSAFFVGSNYQETFNSYGFLYLAVNDKKGTYTDNRGNFDVTIEIKHS